MKQITGISFPFRVGVRGGVVMSTASPYDAAHIKESITQILLTEKNERRMEYHLGCDLLSSVFEPNNADCRALVAFLIKDALKKQETRIEVLSVDVTSQDNTLYATIYFKVPSLGDSSHSVKVVV